jgi:hypothetical protein
MVGLALDNSGTVAFIVSYIPLVGSIVGMVGAMDVWRWEWWQAGLLFFGGLIFAIAAEECLRSSNGYLSGKECDMSQRPLSRPYLSLTAGARISRTPAAT